MSRDHIMRDHANLCHDPEKFCDNRNCDDRDVFNLSRDLSRIYVEVLYEFIGGDPQDESPPCHVWWLLIYSNYKYTVFNMSRDLTKLSD